MKLREIESVRPTTQQGLIAAKPQTPVPSRNVVDSSYFTNQLRQLKCQLGDESRQTKADLDRLTKELERQKTILTKHKELTCQVKNADSEFRVLATTLERCLQGVCLEDLIKEIDQTSRQITVLTKEVSELEGKISDVTAATLKETAPNVYQQKMSDKQLHGQVQLEALTEWIVELLWERTELRNLIHQKECDFEDNVVIQDQYNTLIQALKANAKNQWQESFCSETNECKLDHEIEKITQRVSKLKISSSKLRSYMQTNLDGVNEVQEMKEFLSHYHQSCNDQKSAIYNEEQHIITLLDALVNQQTRNDLFHKLSANQETDQSKIIEALLNQLEQKQIELQKVDILEEKIEKELKSLQDKIDNHKSTERSESNMIRQLSTDISTSSTENHSLKDHQCKLREEAKGLEDSLELKPGYLEAKEDLNEEGILRVRLKELELEEEQIKRSEAVTKEQKQIALELLNQFNTQLMQTTNKASNFS